MDHILTPNKISTLIHIAEMDTPNLEMFTRNNRGIFRSVKTVENSKQSADDCGMAQGAGHSNSVETVADSSLGLLDIDSCETFTNRINQSTSKDVTSSSLFFIPTELSGRSTEVDSNQLELADLQHKMRAQTESVNALIRESNAAELFSGFGVNIGENSAGSLSNECFRSTYQNELTKDQISFVRNAPDNTINIHQTDANFTRLIDQSKAEPWPDMSVGSYFQRGVENIRDILSSPTRSTSISFPEDRDSSPELQPVRGPSAILIEDSISDSSLSISLIAKCLGKLDIEASPSVLLMEAKKNKKEVTSENSTPALPQDYRGPTKTVYNEKPVSTPLSQIQNLPMFARTQNKLNITKTKTTKERENRNALTNNSVKETSCFIVDDPDVISVNSTTDHSVRCDETVVLEIPETINAYVGLEGEVTVKIHSISDRLQEIRMGWQQEDITFVTAKMNHQILTSKSICSWTTRFIPQRNGTTPLTLSLTITDFQRNNISRKEFRTICVDALLPSVKILNQHSGLLEFPKTPEAGLTFLPVLVSSNCADDIPLFITCESVRDCFSIVSYNIIEADKICEAVTARYRGVDQYTRIERDGQDNVVYCEIEESFHSVLKVILPGKKAKKVLRIIVKLEAPYLEMLNIDDDGFGVVDGVLKLYPGCEDKNFPFNQTTLISCTKLSANIGRHRLLYRSSKRIPGTDILKIDEGDDAVLQVVNEGSLATTVLCRVLKDDGTVDKECNFIFEPNFVTLSPNDQAHICIKYSGKYKSTRVLVLEDIVTATQSIWTLMGHPKTGEHSARSSVASTTSMGSHRKIMESPAQSTKAGSTIGSEDGRGSVSDGRASSNDGEVRFPLRASALALSWGAIRIGSSSTQSVRLQNAGSRAHRVRLMVQNVVPGNFTLAPGTPCEFRLAAGEIRLLYVQFQPTSSGPQVARLTFATLRDDKHQRNILLLGTGGSGHIGWGADVCRGTGAALLPLTPSGYHAATMSVFTASLCLVNKGDAPAYFFADLGFTWQFRDAGQQASVEPQLGILGPKEEQRLKITISLTALHDNKDGVGAYLVGTVTVLTGDAASCARAGSLLLKGARHPHRESLVAKLSSAPTVANAALPLVLTFQDTNEYLDTFLSDLSELTAHLTLASDALIPSLSSDTTNDTCDSNYDDDDDDVTLRFQTLTSDTLLMGDKM